MNMAPSISAADTSGVFALLAVLADPEATKKALLEIKEAQDKLAAERESIRQDRVDAEGVRLGAEKTLAEVDGKLTALAIREGLLATQSADATKLVAKAREDAKAILDQARAEEANIRESAEAAARADFSRSLAVSDALRELEAKAKEAEARLATANAAMEALRAQVVGSVEK